MRIAYDLDGVLINTYGEFKRYGDEVLGLPWMDLDITSYSLHDCFTDEDGKPFEEDHFWSIFDEFLKLRGPYIQPFQDAQNVVGSLASEYEQHIITARDGIGAQQTIGLVDHYFPGAFEDIHFDSNKALVCRSLGAKAMVEDCPSNIMDCLDNGITPVVSDAPYNRQIKNVLRMRSFLEAPHLIEQASRGYFGK